MSNLNPKIYINIKISYKGKCYRNRIQCEPGELPKAFAKLAVLFNEQARIRSRPMISVPNVIVAR